MNLLRRIFNRRKSRTTVEVERREPRRTLDWADSNLSAALDDLERAVIGRRFDIQQYVKFSTSDQYQEHEVANTGVATCNEQIGPTLASKDAA